MNTIKESLHEKRKITEEHIRKLQQEGNSPGNAGMRVGRGGFIDQPGIDIRSLVILEMDILDSPVAAVMLALERDPPVAIICKTCRRFSYFISWVFLHSRFVTATFSSTFL